MAKYEIPWNVPSGQNLNVERITILHVLFIYMKDEILDYNKVFASGPSDSVSDIQNATRQKNYLLMQKSINKWDDISFFNMNEDILFSHDGDELYVKLPNRTDVQPFKLDSQDVRDIFKKDTFYKDLCAYIMNGESGIKENCQRIKDYLTRKYSIEGLFLNVQPIDVDKPVAYVRYSKTRSLPTLYVCLFYQITAWKDIETIKSPLMEDFQINGKLREKLFSIIKNDRFSIIGINIDKDSNSNIIQQKENNIEITGNHQTTSHALNSVICNNIQIDQINELISRNAIQPIPLDFFYVDTNNRNHDVPTLHPRFTFHSLAEVLMEKYIDVAEQLFSDSRPHYYIPFHQEIEEGIRKTGFMLIDMVDCKKLFNKKNFSSGNELLKAFQSDIVEIIHKNSGCIISTAGDGIFASVSLPEQYSGLSETEISIIMYEMLLKIALLIQLIPWETRIGIDISVDRFNEGIVGPIELQEYNMLGKNINIASRLEKLIKRFSGDKRNGHVVPTPATGILMPHPKYLKKDWLKNIIAKYGKGKQSFIIDDSITFVPDDVPEAFSEDNKAGIMDQYIYIFKA